jgi:hypothetical protein
MTEEQVECAANAVKAVVHSVRRKPVTMAASGD